MPKMTNVIPFKSKAQLDREKEEHRIRTRIAYEYNCSNIVSFKSREQLDREKQEKKERERLIYDIHSASLFYFPAEHLRTEKQKAEIAEILAFMKKYEEENDIT
jgi:hypothetical protein